MEDKGPRVSLSTRLTTLYLPLVLSFAEESAKVYGLGLTTQSGEGCFMMIKVPMSDTLAYRRLMKHGVMIRSMTGFRFPNRIRVSLGAHEAMEAFVAGLRTILV